MFSPRKIAAASGRGAPSADATSLEYRLGAGGAVRSVPIAATDAEPAFVDIGF
jgi:hypothetical protein